MKSCLEELNFADLVAIGLEFFQMFANNRSLVKFAAGKRQTELFSELVYILHIVIEKYCCLKSRPNKKITTEILKNLQVSLWVENLV